MRLRPMTVDDLELVRSWRNRPEVRESMFTRHVIGVDEHLAYFERALHDPTKRYLVCVAPDDEPVAVVSFVDIDHVHGTATWGFYTGASAPPGTGSWLGLLGLAYAFRGLRLEKVSAEVLDWNTRSMRFHQMLGFRIEGSFRAHHVEAGQRHDVHRLAILAAEWLAREPEMEQRIRATTEMRARFEPGERFAVPLPAAPDATEGDLLHSVADAVVTLHPRPGTRLNALDVRLDTSVPTETPERSLHVEVVRRIGRLVTVALTVAGGDAPRLQGHADLHLPEEER